MLELFKAPCGSLILQIFLLYFLARILFALTGYILLFRGQFKTVGSDWFHNAGGRAFLVELSSESDQHNSEGDTPRSCVKANCDQDLKLGLFEEVQISLLYWWLQNWWISRQLLWNWGEKEKVVTQAKTSQSVVFSSRPNNFS
jgi:hypothetical protein